MQGSRTKGRAESGHPRGEASTMRDRAGMRAGSIMTSGV